MILFHSNNFEYGIKDIPIWSYFEISHVADSGQEICKQLFLAKDVMLTILYGVTRPSYSGEAAMAWEESFMFWTAASP